MDTPECTIDPCDCTCGQWHACPMKDAHGPGKLWPAVDFIKGGKILKSCAACRKATFDRHEKRTAEREAARAQGVVLRSEADLAYEVQRGPQRAEERAAAKASGTYIWWM